MASSSSHTSDLSQSSLPFSHSGTASSSRAVIRHHASVDIVPWIVYEHPADDTNSFSDGQETIRVVGRGGLGSRPHRHRTVSATARTAVPQSLAKPTQIRDASSECSLSDSKSIRVVGRGGYGSKPRIIDSGAFKKSTLNPSGPSTTATPENQLLRIGGRGGAGSRPRAFKPKETKGKRFSWLEKGKTKLRISRPTHPATVSESDDSSIEFAPIPKPPERNATTTSVVPSATFDDYPDTPTATFASATTSSDSNPSFRVQTSRRLNKLYRTLGQSFPKDMAFMSIKAPVLKPVSDGNQVLTRDHSLSRSLSSTRMFPYGERVSAYSRRYSDSFSIQATGSRQDSNLAETTYIDDQFETASFNGTSSRLSPMSFFEPQITQPESEIPDEEGQSSTLFVTYHYPEEPPVKRDTIPFSQYYKPPSDMQSNHDLEIDRAQPWSGGWNADMQHVLTSLRRLH